MISARSRSVKYGNISLNVCNILGRLHPAINAFGSSRGFSLDIFFQPCDGYRGAIIVEKYLTNDVIFTVRWDQASGHSLRAT